MSLPPGFLDELRGRATLSRVVGRKVVWDLRKSNQAKGDLWAPCPFHQEKSASFHVDDRKGFYYCFGCHAKGDAVSFVRETENVGFMEAIEILAREAGMQMPARDPAAAARSDRRGELAKVMEAAVQHYRLQLRTAAGSQARDYLARRKLGDATQERFDIGFAPDLRQGLFQALTAKGIAVDLIVDAGLCARPDDGGPPYDRFRDRIIFPIRDARGRCTGLGGRAMDPKARAKYLNSPETELFDKGRSLYNHGPAREAAAKAGQLVVAEGYMDVIALVEAGFAAAVAPLGTAITEDQLRMLWRIHPEPIIALDGDTAGQRAATRLVDLALPLIEAGQGLRFVILPEGMDPDDMIRQRGADALAKVIDASVPMVRMLWDRETDGQEFDSPERKAALDKRLREAVTRIRDTDIRRYYSEALRQFGWERFRPANWVPEFKRKAGKALVSASAKQSLLARDRTNRVGEMLREQAILAVILKHQDIIPQFEHGLEDLELIADDHQDILLVILENFREHSSESLIAKVAGLVGPSTIEKLFNSAHIQVLPAMLHAGDTELAISTLGENLAKLASERSLRKEVEEAEVDMGGLVDEGLTWRILQATEARSRAERPHTDDDADMGEDRAAMSAQLQHLIDSAAWVKKKH